MNSSNQLHFVQSAGFMPRPVPSLKAGKKLWYDSGTALLAVQNEKAGRGVQGGEPAEIHYVVYILSLPSHSSLNSEKPVATFLLLQLFWQIVTSSNMSYTHCNHLLVRSPCKEIKNTDRNSSEKRQLRERKTKNTVTAHGGKEDKPSILKKEGTSFSETSVIFTISTWFLTQRTTMKYEGRLKSSWTGGSAPLLCRGRYGNVTAAHCRQPTNFSKRPSY